MTYPSRALSSPPPFLRLLLLGILLHALLLVGGCGPSSQHTLPLPQKGDAQSIARTAQALQGIPYRWGGASPETGFDCSGFIWWVMRHNDITVPRTTKEQAHSGRSISLRHAESGDIVVFRINGNRLHTGIIIRPGYFIHSPKAGATIREESYRNHSYWQPRLIDIRRVLP